MAERLDSESLVGRTDRKDAAVGSTPGVQSDPEAIKCLAYNQTRERFLCVDVEPADFSSASLNTHLRSLTRGCGSALWVLPFRGISSTSVRVPLDLIYLDGNCVVLDVVESFPISQADPSRVLADSLLVLPADTIKATGTLPGDRLLLCSPEDMKWRLQHMPEAKIDTRAEHRLVSGQVAASSNARPTPTAIGKVIQMADRADPVLSSEKSPVETTLLEPELAPPALKKISKNWLQRLLAADPPDPRKKQREALTWLTAYFFTGGTPLAHGIRNISVTGLYVITEERWYLGTVIRLTLADQRQPVAERSCTAYAKVVRWGNDGVGFQFVLKDGKDRRRDDLITGDGLVQCVNKMELEHFLQRVRSGTS